MPPIVYLIMLISVSIWAFSWMGSATYGCCCGLAMAASASAVPAEDPADAGDVGELLAQRMASFQSQPDADGDAAAVGDAGEGRGDANGSGVSSLAEEQAVPQRRGYPQRRVRIEVTSSRGRRAANPAAAVAEAAPQQPQELQLEEEGEEQAGQGREAPGLASKQAAGEPVSQRRSFHDAAKQTGKTVLSGILDTLTMPLKVGSHFVTQVYASFNGQEAAPVVTCHDELALCQDQLAAAKANPVDVGLQAAGCAGTADLPGCATRKAHLAAALAECSATRQTTAQQLEQCEDQWNEATEALHKCVAHAPKAKQAMWQMVATDTQHWDDMSQYSCKPCAAEKSREADRPNYQPWQYAVWGLCGLFVLGTRYHYKKRKFLMMRAAKLSKVPVVQATALVPGAAPILVQDDVALPHTIIACIPVTLPLAGRGSALSLESPHAAFLEEALSARNRRVCVHLGAQRLVVLLYSLGGTPHQRELEDAYRTLLSGSMPGFSEKNVVLLWRDRWRSGDDDLKHRMRKSRVMHWLRPSVAASARA